MPHVTLKKYGKGNNIYIAFPGWIHPIESEKKFLDLLCESHTVYSVCLPGYMENKDARTYNDFTVLADETYKLLKPIKGKKVYLGFSMGCRLLTELEKRHPSNIKKIFVGSPLVRYTIPFWAKVMLSNRHSISCFRRFPQFKRFIVNKALSNITDNPSAVFSKTNVTLTGAFDSLIGLLQCQASIENYVNTTQFIYGEHDRYLYDAKSYGIQNLCIIKNAGHNCVRDNEQEVVSCIKRFVH